jgi:hypothetical protein
MVQRSAQAIFGRAPVGAIVVALALAGCGGSSQPSSRASTTAAARATSTPAAHAGGGGASVTAGPVRGVLTAPNHAPTAGKGWPYTVKVTDPNGKPLSGTVDVEFVFAGQIVGRDTPPTHPLTDGSWRDVLTFPAQAVGEPLTFQVVAHTRAGTITLDWPVDVKR